MDSVTVLRTIGNARATKRWTFNPHAHLWKKVTYEAGAQFSPTEHQVADLEALVDVLDRVRRDPRAFVVRGALADWVKAGVAIDPSLTIRRRKHLKNGVEPSLLEVPRQWVMIDIDNWPLPGWADLAEDPETAIDTAVHELLPDAFHDATCWWQLSASAGFAAGYLKCHLFFWLAEPAGNAHLKAVLEQHAPGVDRAPFNAAQPHFIADPIIEGGHDPLPRRTGWMRRLEDAVVLPTLRQVERKPRPAGSGTVGRSGDVADALAYLGHGEGGQGFHEPIRMAVLRYARRCARYGDRDDDGFKDWLREQIRAAPCRPGGNVEVPYCQDYYLQPSIDGAFALLAGDAEIQSIAPHYQAAEHSIQDARDAIAREIDGFLGRVVAWHHAVRAGETDLLPEHAALTVCVGGGKSQATRKALPPFMDALLSERLPFRPLYLVPTHVLGGEVETALAVAGVNVAVLRGREAADPFTVGQEDVEEQRMCLNLPAVNDALRLGYDVEQTVCGTGKPDKPSCPFHSYCGYQRQKAKVAAADVIVAAHQTLFHRLPRQAKKNLGLVIVDEAWWQAGLHHSVPTRIASFAEEVVTHPVLRKMPIGLKAFRYVAAELDSNDLHTYASRAVAAFMATAVGELVSREAVIEAGLTAEDCAAAAKLEWRRKIEGIIYPGMKATDRVKAAETANANASIARRAGIWKALEAFLLGEEMHCGRLQAGTRDDKDGSERVILLHSRSEIRDEIIELPILCLDATQPTAIVKHFLPRLQVLAEIQARTPHMTLHQVVGGWGKNSLVPSERTAPEENRRRQGLVRELADFAALNSGGNALVVTYQAIEPAFAARPGIRVNHFNNVAGLDTYGDIRSLFVIGRPLPDPRELRCMALALTGRPIPAETGHRETRGALMADGTGSGVQVRAYADPDLEALRVAISEAEIIQVIGRGRAVNRTPDAPLDVFVMADVVVPLPVNRLVRWQDIRPSVIERMWARGAVLFGPTDAAKAFPDLFPTSEAAKKALQRANTDFGDIPLGNSTPRDLSPKSPLRITYRPAGRGQQNRTAVIPPDRSDTVRGWLEQMLGPLALFEVPTTKAPAAFPVSRPTIPPAAAEPAPCLEPPAMPKPSPLSAAISLPFRYLAGRRLAPVGDVWTVRQRDGTLREVRPPGTIELPPMVFSTGPDGRRLASKTILFGVQGDAELSRPHPSGHVPDVVIEMKQQPSAGAAA